MYCLDASVVIVVLDLVSAVTQFIDIEHVYIQLTKAHLPYGTNDTCLLYYLHINQHIVKKL